MIPYLIYVDTSINADSEPEHWNGWTDIYGGVVYARSPEEARELMARKAAWSSTEQEWDERDKGQREFWLTHPWVVVRDLSQSPPDEPQVIWYTSGTG